MDLVNDIEALRQRLNTSIVKLRDYGKELAEAERDYKITLRLEALKLRQEKSMPVTLIAQIIYGVPEVADKRYKRDIAETMRDTALENINSLKLQIRILESQLQREWGANLDR
ncbi:MAG: hypothetical protein J6T74_08980 [Clostridia bacterium]|nr:hypothetical protein [Clostridia bacterium]